MIELDNETIKQKKELLKKAEKTLKAEFVGIDDIIDGVLTNMRPWFLYPELQDRPMVITMVGLTGVGKTALIHRLTELLEIDGDMVYYNFAEIGELKSWEVEDTIEDMINNGKPNKVFVYDEFQYAATIDETGDEKDNKSGLKAFWEIMDSGILHHRVRIAEIRILKTIISYAVKIHERCPIVLSEGKWTNAEECIKCLTKEEAERYSRFFNMGLKTSTESEYYEPILGNFCETNEKDGLFLKRGFIDRMKPHYEHVYEHIDDLDFYKKICSKSIEELILFMDDLAKKIEKGYNLVFNKSVVFIMMNLDEAYEMSFNVNPDMLPDQFHKITKKLTIVDIKKALRKRFRNEQIGRMGNIFMIYPSFSEDAFRKIIDLLLNKYKSAVKSRWNLDIEFDDTIKDLVYKDSVFPTHGTRPIISSVHEIIKTKLPVVIDNMTEKGVENVERMFYSYDGENVNITSYNGDTVVCETAIPQPLRIENHRTSTDKDQQALIAMHESGHFVIYVKLHGRFPEKVCATTIDKETGGFMLRDDDEVDRISSKKDLLNNIKVSLGGYVAEKMAFGDDHMTCGASKDLDTATKIASAMIRNYGLGSSIGVTTYMISEQTNPGGLLINEDSRMRVNAEIDMLIRKSSQAVENVFNDPDWRKMLKETAKYLSEHTVLPKDKMEELYSLIPESKRTESDESFYRNAIDKF